MDAEVKNDPISVLQSRLLGELPDDIAMACDAYHRLAREAAGIMEAKDFSAHQTACKAALGHLESLIKLLRWTCEGVRQTDDETPDKANVDKLIAEARYRLSRA